MRFGQRIKELRSAKGLTQRDLGTMVDVEFSYISKIENSKLDFGEYPSEALIHRLAESLDADEFELLVLAEKIPPEVRDRFFERPEAFRKLAGMSDRAIDRLMKPTERQRR